MHSPSALDEVYRVVTVIPLKPVKPVLSCNTNCSLILIFRLVQLMDHFFCVLRDRKAKFQLHYLNIWNYKEHNTRENIMASCNYMQILNLQRKLCGIYYLIRQVIDLPVWFSQVSSENLSFGKQRGLGLENAWNWKI